MANNKKTNKSKEAVEDIVTAEATVQQESDPIIEKWEGIGFLDGIKDSDKRQLSRTYEKLYLFIKDLDDNKRFNHGDLQELMDLGTAMFYDIIPEYPSYELDTNDLFRLFFNTKLNKLGVEGKTENPIKERYGEYAIYKFIRLYLLHDNGESLSDEFAEDIESLLASLMEEYFVENYVKPAVEVVAAEEQEEAENKEAKAE